MAKRIYSQTVIKWLIATGASAGTLIGGIFLYLFIIGAISNVSHSGDMVCAGTLEDPCLAYINFTANEDIFLYPTGTDPWGRNTTFDFDPNVKSWSLQRSWGSGWRNIPLNKSCLGTWCGLSNAADERKFSYAFRKGRNYSIRIVAYKNSPQDVIKWSAFDGEIDPVWYGTPEEPVRYTPPYTIGEKCYSSYDSVNKVITDTSCLQFKTESNGVITVNDDRYLAFALKGTIYGTEYTYTSMDFEWNWHMNESNGDYVFWAENDNPNFIWKQYYYFYEDYNKPMKIEHYLENNLADITDMQMYYLTNVLPDDEIGYNTTRYFVSDYMGLHKTGDFNEIIPSINFNAMYDFNFVDLINSNFTINEFYIGSGSIIDKPNINITAVGFTKNDGNFPKGSSVLIDPTFTTASVDSIDVTALDERTVVVSWADATLVDKMFAVYDTNGTALTSVITVDDTYRLGIQNGISVSALNSTNFAIAYSDSGSDINVAVYDREGNVVLNPVQVDSSADTYPSVSVSAFNSTHFVVGFFDDADDDATFSVYDIAGTLISGPIDVDIGMGNPFNTPVSVTVSTFNSTDFVIAFSDTDEDDVTYAIYNVAGTLLSGPTDVDTATYNGFASSVATLSSTQFVIAWYDSQYPDDEVKYAVYSNTGTEIVAPTAVDKSGAVIPSVSVSALNSTHFVVSWFDASEGDSSFSIFDTSGNMYVNGSDFSTTALQWEDTASYQAGTDIGICNNNFIGAFVISTSLANWTAYYPNGTVWDGVCVEAPANTCTCPASPATWEINMTDHCNITADCNIYGYNLSFVSGEAADMTNISAMIICQNVDFNTTGYIHLDSDAYLNTT